MENSTPVVTVVIPCHNHENWVGEAIDSILAQDYPKERMQLIVVDDGSQDRSVDKVRSRIPRPNIFADKNIEQYSGFIEGLPTMHVSLPRAGGPAAARNLGIKIGWEGTELFALLDSDDIYKPSKISKSVEVYLRNPQHIAVVYSDTETFGPHRDYVISEYLEPYSKGRLLEKCILNCDSIVSKTALENVGLFCEELEMAEDYDLWIRISEKYVLCHIPEPLVMVRTSPRSLTRTASMEKIQRNHKKVSDRLTERMKANAQRR